MGKFFVVYATLLVLVLLLVRGIRSREGLRFIKREVGAINEQYRFIFTQRPVFGMLMQTGLLLLAQFFVGFNIVVGVISYVDTYLGDTFDLLVKVFIIAAGFMVIYLAVGYVLKATSDIYQVFYRVEDQNIKTDLILSYFLLSIYFTALVIFPRQVSSVYVIGMIGTAVCYVLNLKVLLKVIRNPQRLRSKNAEKVTPTGLVVVAVLILIMIVLNLFLAVCFISSSQEGAYSGVQSNFDLFYYTLITFTTIGYGDIVPVSTMARIMSMIISTTSVICLTVFLSSVLSYQEKDE